MALAPSLLSGAVVITDGSVVGGSVLAASLDVAGGDVGSDPVSALSNDVSGNLLFTPSATDSNTDWAFTLRNLGLDSSTYSYVQIDFVSVTAGAVSSPWTMFHTDSNSSIGGANNSSQSLGTVALAATPFSVVIDLDGGATGGPSWGPGTVNNIRFDAFEGSNDNKGKTFTISAITFGSEWVAIPEPSSALLVSLAGLVLLRRRR